MYITYCYDKFKTLRFYFFFPLDVKTVNLMTLLPPHSESLPLLTLKIRQSHFSQVKGALLCTLGTAVQGLVTLNPFSF